MMNTLFNRKRTVLYVALTAGLAALFLAALMIGLHGTLPAQADSDIFYVDGATGQDIDTCGTSATPCKTISYTLNTRASSSDTIRVAQGVYTENLFITKAIRLEGGYEATNWTRDVDQYETIIDGSNSRPIMGEWDEKGVRYATVITDDSGYKMWYVGYDRNDVGRIGYATSPDGLNWTKHSGNPVFDVGSGSAWDSEDLETPFIVKENGIYKMWYSGRGTDGYWRTGYATSTDGINWSKYAGNPVLDVGTQDWNNRAVHSPSVLHEDSLYKMWLYAAGDDGSGWTPYIAYATSSNGLDWTWDGASPLFSRDSAHDWESDWIWRPNVLHVGSDYQMWYSGWDGDRGHTGYATATHETNWTKYNGGVEPVLSGAPGEWDEEAAYDPSVLYAGGVYTMWYDNGTSIGVATSTNGIAWTKSVSNPVLSPGTKTDWGDPVVLIYAPDSKSTVLDGFTVRNGYEEDGGGIYVAASQATIQNCTVMSNTAHGSGGGINVEWEGADTTISNTRVISNSAGSYGGGIEVDNDALATIVNSEVISNTAIGDGGGGVNVHNGARGIVTNSRILSNTVTQGWGSAGIMISNDGFATVHSNEIAWNRGIGDSSPSGAMRVHASSVVTITHNDIHANTGGGGGGIAATWYSTLNVHSNTIANNQEIAGNGGGGLRLTDQITAVVDSNVIVNNHTESSGGGIATDDSNLTMTNNVIAFNTGPDGDGIIVWSGSGSGLADVDIINNTIVSNATDAIGVGDGTVLVRNNVLYGHEGDGAINQYGDSTITSDHNVFWGNAWISDVPTGTGDIEVNPLFVDAASGDFHLQAGSPCINAGTSTGAPAVDIEGTPRGATPDIGAYEWGKHRIFLPLTVRNVGS
jgi:predicted GH43/DUF377 family glycosyl hydrolase